MFVSDGLTPDCFVHRTCPLGRLSFDLWNSGDRAAVPRKEWRRRYASKGVFGWQPNFWNHSQGSFVFSAFAFVLVIFSGAWISADHQKVLGCLQSLVAGACRQDNYIACAEINRSALFPAETNPHVPSCDAKDFMRSRVVMYIIINAVAPMCRTGQRER